LFEVLDCKFNGFYLKNIIFPRFFSFSEEKNYNFAA